MRGDTLDSEVVGRDTTEPREVSVAEALRIGGREGMIAGGSIYLIGYLTGGAFVAFEKHFLMRHRVSDSFLRTMYDALVWPIYERAFGIAILSGAVLTVTSGYLFGRIGGRSILHKGRNALLTTLGMAYCVVLTSLFGMFLVLIAQHPNPLRLLRSVLRDLDEIIPFGLIFCLAIFLPLWVGSWFFGRRVERRAGRRGG